MVETQNQQPLYQINRRELQAQKQRRSSSSGSQKPELRERRSEPQPSSAADDWEKKQQTQQQQQESQVAEPASSSVSADADAAVKPMSPREQLRAAMLFFGLDPEEEQCVDNPVGQALAIGCFIQEVAAESEWINIDTRLRFFWLNLARDAMLRYAVRKSDARRGAHLTSMSPSWTPQTPLSPQASPGVSHASPWDEVRDSDLVLDLPCLCKLLDDAFEALGEPDRSKRHALVRSFLERVVVGKAGFIPVRDLEDELRYEFFSQYMSSSASPASPSPGASQRPQAQAAEDEVEEGRRLTMLDDRVRPEAEQLDLLDKTTHVPFEPLRDFFGIEPSPNGNICVDMVKTIEMLLCAPIDQPPRSGVLEGLISTREEVEQRRRTASRRLAKCVLDCYDRDGDGCLDRAELLACVCDAARALFGPDSIQQDQQDQGAKLMRCDTAPILESFDQDKDGKLSIDEFAAFLGCDV